MFVSFVPQVSRVFSCYHKCLNGTTKGNHSNNFLSPFDVVVLLTITCNSRM